MEKKIALLGMGTVGSGVIKLFRENEDLIKETTGLTFTITHILVSDTKKVRDIDVSDIHVTANIEEISLDNIDLVVEVMGGIDDTKDLLLQILELGIPVVTANKDMLAIHIDELEEKAIEANTKILYEAAVAGGIPIINSMKYNLNSNKVNKVMGILNGTTNYMLTKMRDEGWDYELALSTAQDIGYAEADPTADVEGIDAGRKILLLARLAFHKKFDFNQVTMSGISGVDIKDVNIAKSNGFTLKLLGVAEAVNEVYHLSVSPILISNNHQLSSVKNEKNAVYITGNGIGEAMFYGPGAGSLETASAVLSDMINVFNIDVNQLTLPTTTAVINNSIVEADYYIRFSEDIKTVQNVLDGENVSYEILDDKNSVCILTVDDESSFITVTNKLTLKVSYQILGADL